MSWAIPSAHNYHDWVFASFSQALGGGTVLEVGAGHGEYSRRLARKVDRLLASDIDPLAVDRLRRELADVPNVECVAMEGVDPSRLPVPLDGVVALNLLEHIEDDRLFLRRCGEVLAPGGRLVLFVPAFAALYGNLDREAGHFRRYRREPLRALLADCGFRVESSRYFNAVGFFGWWVNKHLGARVSSNATGYQVMLYNRLIPILKHVDRVLPWMGQSLVLIARKEP
jgi:SAM-dependent methyltransferase